MKACSRIFSRSERAEGCGRGDFVASGVAASTNCVSSDRFGLFAGALDIDEEVATDRRIDSAGQWFFVISYRYDALAERRMMNCGRRMMDAAIAVLFSSSRGLALLVSPSCCTSSGNSRTTEIFNYLRKLAARWVIEGEDPRGNEPLCKMNNREICEIREVKLEICEILISRGK